MIHLRTFFTDIFEQWGFDSPTDYVKTVLGVKSMTAAITPIALKVSFVALGLGLSLWTTWIWNPPGASFLILGMDLANAWYGYQVARQIKGEKFNRFKFQKTYSIIVSDILLMSMMHQAIKHYPYYASGRDVLFSYLFGFKFTGIFNHFVMLKLQSGSLVGYFREWMLKVLQTKVGAQMVDAVQGREPSPPPPAAEPEAAPPADEPAAT